MVVRALTKRSLSLDGAMGVSFVAVPIYALYTLVAFIDAMSTKFNDEDWRYYFTMVGMPVFLIGWFYTVLVGGFDLVPAKRLWATLFVAVLTVIVHKISAPHLGG